MLFPFGALGTESSAVLVSFKPGAGSENVSLRAISVVVDVVY